MFSLEDAYTNITLEEILSKVSEYDLWKYYCSNFDSFNRSFKSELYNDTNPSCRVFLSSNNKLLYKDFGSGEVYSITDYIMKKYFCNYKECLTIIANDFRLNNVKKSFNKEVKLLNFEENYKHNKTTIDIVYQQFNITDFNYWNQYKISLSLLQEYNVYSCKYIHITKNNSLITYTYAKTNPIYAYRFINDDNPNKFVYKIYFPLADKKNKWFFNGSANNIEGFDQLDLSGDLLILTKSLKDCMVYRLLGYNAISLQGETNKLDIEIYHKLSKRFENIVINYDNDEEGIKGTNKLIEQYGLKYFYIDKHKDISDFIKNEDYEKTIKMLKNKIKKLYE